MIYSNLSIDSSARKISELDQINELAGDDMLEFDRSGDGTTYCIQLSSIVAQLSTDAMKDVFLKSAAYTQRDQYAGIAHGHPYSDFDYCSDYGPNSLCASCSATLIGNFKIANYKETRTAPVYVPAQRSSTTDSSRIMPKIGEIKMLAVPNFNRWLTQYKKYQTKSYSGKTNIDINSSSFDGWVVPNGTTFTGIAADEFTAACLKFGSSHNASDTSFTVPDIAGFFKCCNTSTGAMATVNKQNAYPAHSHSINNITNNANKTITVEKYTISASTVWAGSGSTKDTGRVYYDSNFWNTITATATAVGSPIGEKSWCSSGGTYYYDRVYMDAPINSLGESNVLTTNYPYDAAAYDHLGYLNQNAIKITSVALNPSTTTNSVAYTGVVDSQLEQYPDYQLVPALIYIGLKK